ncbi:SPL family radical SAM protein [Sulfobacillus harzensis]|uniref:Radical SAM protein n=1 Tax=Sulfobacillus harzensis TaxID=2729629 RepID=A0A7Y0L616_9FIRM|nr:radical SAM protein [Sulfobacillus harzensis]NMP23875.1 radical SAM protein [Sulfobacillus harzensis]
MRSIQLWQAGAVLNRSPKGQHMGFDYSLNPYRGCSHACRYCYARESHTYLDLNVAEDFEQKLFVKENLAVRLNAELRKIPLDAVIAIGTATDPYQPLEGHHHLTRQALQLLLESGHPFTVTTKSPLIERDIDLLAAMGARGQVGVHISLLSTDKKVIRALEPGTSPPDRRLATIRRLKAAHIPVGVFVAPIIPGLSDQPDALKALFSAIREAGADWAMTSTTRLSDAIRDYFINQVATIDPKAAAHIRSLYGSSQFVEASYRRVLSRQLDHLYREFQIGRHGPRLHPHRVQEQLEFFEQPHFS